MDTDVLTTGTGCLCMKDLEVQDNKPFISNVALNCSCNGGQWRTQEFCSGKGGG